MSTERLAFWFHSADGQRVFQHLRIPRKPTPDNPRTKGYPYRYPKRLDVDGDVIDWTWGKHPLADTLIYQLPIVLANCDDQLWISEGERAAHLMLSMGILATSGHGGAGKFTESQAESLRRHDGEIILIADRDVPGAYDACRKFDLLRAAGIPADRLRVVKAAVSVLNADARDHFEAGYRLRDFEPVDLGRLREVAAEATSGDFTAAGYATPEELETLRNWKPTYVNSWSSLRPTRADRWTV